jgi:hypothetical protein
MNPARTPQGSYVAPVIVYPDTGESGEAYDLDLQTFPQLVRYRPLSMVSTLDATSAGPDHSESGEAYEAEVGASHLNGEQEGLTALRFVQFSKVLHYPKD